MESNFPDPLKEACRSDIDIAAKALNHENPELAWFHYRQSADRLFRSVPDGDSQAMFVSSVLNLSSLSFALGKRIGDLPDYLHKAHAVVQQLGDARSHAMLNLHLGSLYYFSDRRPQAMVALSTGLTEIEELGDEDILDQSAAFVGLFYFMQGRFREALEHLERADRIFKSRSQGQIRNPITPILHGYCLAYLGEFHHAIGCLDFHWRSARERSDHTLAVTLRVILGTVLMLVKREKEGHLHIDEAVREASDIQNAFALYLAAGPVAMRYMAAGEIEAAYNTLLKTFKEGASAGLVRQYASPWILEMLYEFEQRGFDMPPQLAFDEALKRAATENNIHLHGVALRLRAGKRAKAGDPSHAVLADLENSRNYLENSGDVIQLAKTCIELARLALSQKHRENARQHAKAAWTAMGGYSEDFFPDDIRFLLNHSDVPGRVPETPRESFERYIELTESMFPVNNQDEILSKALAATNRFFGAERGGLFWFTGGQITHKPELRASCNLCANHVKADDFKNHMQMVITAFSTKRPLLRRGRDVHPAKSLLCLPVQVYGKTRGVIYHDNSYLEDCFDFLDEETIEKVVVHINRQVARMYEFLRLKEAHSDLISEKSLQDTGSESNGLIYKSRPMRDLTALADKAAAVASNILLLGETGVGKELIARRIHDKSPRRKNAFIVVDATAIPEGLVESELFGHEKGAFTGADRQKKGRLELADKGTLFIDEIGELPFVIQGKLLRAIQERSFFRVGGARIQSSDFRLIVATNRDLATEVINGRFREDLYYRLNVVPLHIPPLRDRKDDVMLLANHFLSRFARKFGRRGLTLDPASEAAFRQYNWPGNIRELENVMERAVLLASGDQLKIDLPVGNPGKPKHPFSEKPTLAELEKKYIKHIMESTGGRIGGPGGASEILGLKRPTLYARMKKLGLK